VALGERRRDFQTESVRKQDRRLKETNSLAAAVSRFGASVKSKLSGVGAVGAPEDQIRAPLEALIADVAQVLLFRAGEVVAVGESTLSALKTRPDYAVKVSNALIGFIEVKAPGKAPTRADSRTSTTGSNGGN
jgi:hypothetical protein